MERNLARTDGSRKWGILATVCGGLFMIMLQSNVINLAVTHIQKDFGVALSAVEWINNGYLLVFTVLLVLMGRVGDKVGRKITFLTGLVVYVLGAFVGGSAATLRWVILGTVIEGIGASAMMPATLSIIQVTFPKEERGMALGIWGAVSGLAVAVGPTLGGFLTEIGLGPSINSVLHLEQGWRAIYFVSCLLGVIVFIAALLVLRESRADSESKSFDFAGTVLSGLALFMLVYAVINGSDYGWISRKKDFLLFGANLTPGGLSVIPIFFALALVFGFLFVIRERTCRGEPLIDLNLFRDRNFTAGSIVAAILFFSMMGTFFLIPVFLQGVLGFSAIKTGVALLPLAIMVLVASPVAGWLSDVVGGKRVIICGLVVLCVGGILTARFTPTTPVSALILPFALEGLGIGLANAPITNMALRTVPLNQAGAASGTLSMIRQLGSLLGIAVLAGIFSTAIPGAMASNAGKMDPSVVPATITEKIVTGLSSGASTQPTDAEMSKMLGFYSKSRAAEIQTAVSGAMKQGMTDAINYTFRYAAAVAAFAACVAFVLRDKKREGGKKGRTGKKEAQA
jgi:EmrB/QacA subfamily drug resistance transporter